MKNQDIVADYAEAYHRLKKQLRSTYSKQDFEEQVELLNEQWWADTCVYFGWKDIKDYYAKKI